MKNRNPPTETKRPQEVTIGTDDDYTVVSTTIGSAAIGGGIGSVIAGPIGIAVGVAIGGIGGFAVSHHERQSQKQ